MKMCVALASLYPPANAALIIVSNEQNTTNSEEVATVQLLIGPEDLTPTSHLYSERSLSLTAVFGLFVRIVSS